MEAAAAGRKLQRCRLAFLDAIPAPRRVLLAGEGHGRFLPECIRRFPEAEIVVVDSSSKMLEIAKSKVGTGRVEFIHADLLDGLPLHADFDLIVTHFFLDCFSEDAVAAIVSNLGKVASSDAQWLLADFQVSSGRFAKIRNQCILWLLYRFFRISCGLEAGSLVAPEPHLAAAGFLLHRRVTYDWGLLKSEWWRRE